MPNRLLLTLATLNLAACATPAEPADPCVGPGARSTCLSPTQTDEYYIDQSLRYFDTLDASADPESEPTYAELVARWDPRAEGEDVGRLSTRVPGLGTASGRIDPLGEEMTLAGQSDPELADFAARTQDFWTYWVEA